MYCRYLDKNCTYSLRALKRERDSKLNLTNSPTASPNSKGSKESQKGSKENATEDPEHEGKENLKESKDGTQERKENVKVSKELNMDGVEKMEGEKKQQEEDTQMRTELVFEKAESEDAEEKTEDTLYTSTIGSCGYKCTIL